MQKFYRKEKSAQVLTQPQSKIKYQDRTKCKKDIKQIPANYGPNQVGKTNMAVFRGVKSKWERNFITSFIPFWESKFFIQNEA